MKFLAGNIFCVFHNQRGCSVSVFSFVAETLVPGDGVLCHEKGTLALQRRE